MLRKPGLVAMVVATLILGAAGCGARRDVCAPVRGRVLYRGMPVPRGSVVFAPDTQLGGDGPLAAAEIQSDGSYALKTGDQAGAPPGHYRVTIVAVEVAPYLPPGQRFTEPRTLVPEKYRDPDLSGLACEVKAGHENAIDFNLE